MDLKNFTYSDLVNMEKDLSELIEKSFWDFPAPYEINILDLHYYPDKNKIIIIDTISGIEEKELVFKDRQFFSSIPANYEKFFYPNSLNTKRHKEPIKAEAPDKTFINEDFLKDHFNIDKKSIQKDLELIIDLKTALENLRSEKVTRLFKNLFTKEQSKKLVKGINSKQEQYLTILEEYKAKNPDIKTEAELIIKMENDLGIEGETIRKGIYRERVKQKNVKRKKEEKDKKGQRKGQSVLSFQ